MFATQSASNRTAVNTLSYQLKAQSTAFERQLAAKSAVFSVITERLNHLELNFETRPDPSNRDHQQSTGGPSRSPTPTDPTLRSTRRRDQPELRGHPPDQTCISKSQQSPAQRPFFHPPASPDFSSLLSRSRIVATVPADLVWEPADRDIYFKASSRQRFTEAFGHKIRLFLFNAELFLTLCNMLQDR